MAVERGPKFVKGHRLDLAFHRNIEFGTDRTGEIHLKTGRSACLIGEIEGREIECREESQPRYGGKIRLCQSFARIEEQWKCQWLQLSRLRDRQGYNRGKSKKDRILENADILF